MCSESLPVFNNLNSLAIWSGGDRGWQAMPALLRNCPNLETLVIKVIKTSLLPNMYIHIVHTCYLNL